MTYISGFVRLFFQKYIVPKSVNKDDARKEFILNILLVGLIILSTVAFFINITQSFFSTATQSSSAPWITGSILVLLCGLFTLSRYGKSYVAADILILTLFGISLYLNYSWGADIPVMLVFVALTIIIAGILIDTRAALILTLLNAGCILLFTHLEVKGLLHPNIVRKYKIINMTDSFVNVVILCVISLVSWLSNREIEKALHRAQESEKALQKERDSLEITVEKRTAEIQKMQMEKIVQVYRFADFGKLAMGMIHDLITPLNVVSLNLESLQEETKRNIHYNSMNIKNTLERAVDSTKNIESFVKEVRSQLQGQQTASYFDLVAELKEVIGELSHKANRARVKLECSGKKTIRTFGNSFRFHQVATNLISNAIDAYVSLERTNNRTIKVRISQKDNNALFEVEDFAVGMSPDVLSHIFNSFYSTKPKEKGMGIGLTICKDIVEKDFKGKITVQSQPQKGAIFQVQLPIMKKGEVNVNDE